MRDGERGKVQAVRRARWLASAVVAALLCVPAMARAEPYLMVRSGAKCSDCHTNITGGGKRTAFTYIHSHEILRDLQILPIPKGVKAFNGDINQWVSIGADLRVRDTVTFSDTPNAQGRVPGYRFFRGENTSNNLAVDQFTTYFQVDLLQDMLTFYVDENFNGVAQNREAMAIIRGFAPWGLYLKGGRFFPTYGLRLWDDQAFVRSQVGYTFKNPDEGAEIGIMPGPFYLGSSVVNGLSGDNDVAVTVNGYAIWDDVPVVQNLMIGGSYARQSNKRDAYCIYAGANLWKFTYLFEVDGIDDRNVIPSSQRVDWVAYAEVDFLMFNWLNLHTEYNYVKFGGGNPLERWVIGFDPFIDRFIQPRILYRANMGPGSQPDVNQPQLWIELHTFF